jgi:hypothetical protein
MSFASTDSFYVYMNAVHKGTAPLATLEHLGANTNPALRVMET